MARVIRIVPNPASADGTTRTQGTQVVLGDTDIASGIRKITLVAEPSSVWVAHIECTVEPPNELAAEIGEVWRQIKTDV